MKITDEKGCYWTETKGEFTDEEGNKIYQMKHWSRFDQLPGDKRDFNFIKAYLLIFMMRLSGIKAKGVVLK